MRSLRLTRKLRHEEEGAVTIDWVLLTAAVVTLAAIAMGAISNNLQTVSGSIGTYLDGAAATLSTAPEIGD